MQSSGAGGNDREMFLWRNTKSKSQPPSLMDVLTCRSLSPQKQGRVTTLGTAAAAHHQWEGMFSQPRAAVFVRRKRLKASKESLERKGIYIKNLHLECNPHLNPPEKDRKIFFLVINNRARRTTQQFWSHSVRTMVFFFAIWYCLPLEHFWGLSNHTFHTLVVGKFLPLWHVL